MTTRRGFLKSGGLALFGVGMTGGIPAFLAEAAARKKTVRLFNKDKIIVTIFQRGAMDGLAAVTPFNDPFIEKARPNLFISPSKKKSDRTLIDLDGMFGLHPEMNAFESLFREKRLAIVHGIGSPNNTRSHFDAQDYMELGTPFSKSTDSGWLNRASLLMGHDASSPFRSVSMTSSLPRSLYGESPALAISSLQNFLIQVRGGNQSVNFAARGFEDLYDQAADDILDQTGKESFAAMNMLQKADLQHYKPSGNAQYPNSPLGNSLRQIAQLIKMDVGLEIAFAESNGWDTHMNQGRDIGTFARNVADLSNSIVAFWTDIEAFHDEVVVMTMTEFGRTVKQNGTGGTDHGRASCNFILGNNVRGGIVHGKVDSLSPENLEDGRDLPVTTDFRSVFGEVANQHLLIRNNKSLFPGWEGKGIGVMS